MTTPLKDPGSAAKKISDFLEVLEKIGDLDLKPHILACNGQVQPEAGPSAGEQISAGSAPLPVPCITVDFTGTDTPLLLSRNGELLHAIEHIAAKVLRLEPEEHDLISFDAEGFKANRDRELYGAAESAIEEVRSTGRPHFFPPMTSRERRMLHVALAKSGLPTASSGEGPRRFVVLYPKDHQPAAAVTADRAQAVRSRFRRRSS